jgi:DNA repair exonuclease SbcCD ATPase subunit
MILKLEIKNFESHEHTVFEFTEGFNAIVGDGDSGKTSALRALNLVAFNKWNPDSLRLGCKNCEVTVTTERGTVKVTRGKDNRWEVTPKGGQTQIFDKIGKDAILPEAAQIIGLRPVKIGDTETNINIAGQLEKHFMMAELNGKKASGSLRAQIVDEISGLAGMETIIKDVSLDNTRSSKEIKRQEQNIKDVKQNKHDEDELNEEQRLLDKVKDALDNLELSRKQMDKMQSCLQDFQAVKERIVRTEQEMTGLPNTKRLSAMVDNIQEICDKIASMANVAEQASQSTQMIDDCQQKLVDCEEELVEADKDYNDALASFTVCPITLEPIEKFCPLYKEENK